MDQTLDQPARERRSYTFAMRVNARERRLLEALATCLQRTKSDVVRLLVREAARLEGISPSEDGNGVAKGHGDGT